MSGVMSATGLRAGVALISLFVAALRGDVKTFGTKRNVELNRPTAHFAIFNISLVIYGCVQQHANAFTAVRAVKKLFVLGQVLRHVRRRLITKVGVLQRIIQICAF